MTMITMTMVVVMAMMLVMTMMMTVLVMPMMHFCHATPSSLYPYVIDGRSVHTLALEKPYVAPTPKSRFSPPEAIPGWKPTASSTFHVLV